MTLLPYTLIKGDKIKRGKTVWQILRRKPHENRIGEHIYLVRRVCKKPLCNFWATEKDIVSADYVKV